MTLLLPFSIADFYTLTGNQDGILARYENMNPFQDPFINYLQTLMVGCLAGSRSRPPYMNSAFWNQMPVADQLLAEVEGMILENLFQDYMAIQKAYITEEYLPFVDLPEPGTPKFESFVKKIHEAVRDGDNYQLAAIAYAESQDQQAFTFVDVGDYLFSWRIPMHLMPTSHPAVQAYTREILEKMNLQPNQKILSHAGDTETMELTLDKIRRWREAGVQPYSLLAGAHAVWALELMSRRFTSNSLSGPAARNRTLLVDGDIPLVTPLTFHAWWALCGIEAIELSQHQFYIAFQNPHLPVTKDHLAQTLQSEDSHANHSLPGRSGGQLRTESGRIIHGRHYAWAYQNCDMIHRLDIENSMSTRPGAKLRADLPFIPKRLPDLIWGSHEDVQSMIQDPWQTAGMYLHADWIRDYPISTAMRFIARHMNYHFMFTDTASGHRALDLWRDSMLQSAQQWCEWMTGPGKDLRITMQLGEQYSEQMGFKVSQKDGKTKSHKRFNFDFDGMSL